MLLIVDDDLDIRESLSDYFNANGFDTKSAENAEVARAALANHRFEAIILDVMMPGEDGLSLCRYISETYDTPILMLTALNEDMDRIVGLEIGADDYLAKPFNPRELLARIRAILRRRSSRETPETDLNKIYYFDNWQFDAVHHQLIDPEGSKIEMTSGEAKLLQVLLGATNRVLSRDYLLEQVSDRIAGVFDRSIDNQISRLRKKLERDPRNPTYIKTVRGGGYRFAGNLQKGKSGK